MKKLTKAIKTGLAHNKPMTGILLTTIGLFGLLEGLRGDVIGILIVVTLGLICVALHVRCALLERNWSGQ